MEKEYEIKTVQEDIVSGLHRLIARQNARLPQCQRLTQSEETKKVSAMIIEITKKLTVANKKPAPMKARA